MNIDDWMVPPVATGAVTLVSGRDFVISDSSGDMVRGAVHGLIHDDRRYLDIWSMRLEGLDLRSLAVTTPTPFSAVFVARAHEMDGRPLPLLIIRRRWVGRGMREVIELHNSGREPLQIGLTFGVGADFGHLLDVKSGRIGFVHGSVVAQAEGIGIVPVGGENHHRTSIRLRPGATTLGPQGWSVRVDVGAHEHSIIRITVDPVAGDDAVVDVDLDRETAAVDELSHHRYRSWHERVPTVVSSDPRVTIGVRTALEDLASLRIFDAAHPELTVVAAGAPWYMTLFGRDSLLTAHMTLPFAPELARGVLHELAELQGRTLDPVSGEAPGKILHELRSHGGGGPFSERSRYYGTVDATPLYVLVAAEAIRWGAVSTADRGWLIPAVDAAIGWLHEHGDGDGDGFVDYAPHHDLGLSNQGWKDSWDGVTFADGTLPTAPIALVEVQGYAYAALLGAAEIYTSIGRLDDAAQCAKEAAQLRIAFNRAFWDERGWFVEAISAGGRPVDSLGSNPGHALWTGIADHELANCYLDLLVSDEMWSGWGVRTLATSMGAYDPLSYHNGSVWPHDTAICAAGAARYGRWDVVDRLTDGLLDSSMYFGGRLPELFAGLSRSHVPVPVPYPGSCSPQAWASASLLLLLRTNLGLEADAANRTITVDPRGSIATDISCERLVVGGRHVSLNFRAGILESKTDGIEVIDIRDRTGHV